MISQSESTAFVSTPDRLLAPLLFPAYTPETVERRFPTDVPMQRRVLVLRAWFLNNMPAAEIVENMDLSLATLYRVRQRWQTAGIAGLFSPPRSSPITFDLPRLRTLIYRVRSMTSFALGCMEDARALAPKYPDPAQRGQAIVAGVREAIMRADALCESRVGIASLLDRHFLQGMGVALLSQMTAYSSASLHRFLLQGLQDVNRVLPDALNAIVLQRPWTNVADNPYWWQQPIYGNVGEALTKRHCVQLIGADTRATAGCAAAIAETWAQAGWNVFWLRADADTDNFIQTAIADLANQMAAVGLLRVARRDPERTIEQHLAQLMPRLGLLPTLLVITNDDGVRNPKEWVAFLTKFHLRKGSARLLLTGAPSPLECGEAGSLFQL